MKTRIEGKIPYGNKIILEIDIEADVSNAVALIGPNLAGKSLLLKCLYERARTRIGRPIIQFPSELTCNVEKEGYVAIYVDAFRSAAQLYEKVQDTFEAVRQITDFIDKWFDDIELRKAANAVSNAVDDVENIFGFRFLLEAKKLADDLLVADAVRQFNELYEEMTKKAEKAKTEFKELFDDFFPLTVSITPEGFTWMDRKVGASGRSLQSLSTVYTPALVVLSAIFAFSIPRETYFLVEEPEAFAHPLVAQFIGAYLRRLVKRSNGRLNVVAETHSPDFIRGFWNNEDAKVYVFRRYVDGNRVVLRVAEQWQGEGHMPGFTDSVIYKLL